MQIRGARDEDVEGALAVWQRSLGAEGTRPSKERLSELRRELTAPGALLLVAADDDVHGFSLAGLDGELVRVTALHVTPGRRRQGLGGQLLEALADAAYLAGARRLALECAGAAQFLLAAGLAPVGTREVAGGRAVVQYEAELEPPVQDLAVREDGLRLGQLLKLAAFVDTGAQAKALLAAGGVQVNGEVEVRRGRQIAAGDVVVAQDHAVRVVPAG